MAADVSKLNVAVGAVETSVNEAIRLIQSLKAGDPATQAAVDQAAQALETAVASLDAVVKG